MSRLLDDSQRDRRRPPQPPAPQQQLFTPSNHALAREVGWKGARKGTANAEEKTVEAADHKHAVKRIPIGGIKGKGLPDRAIVVLPAFRTGDEKSLDVLLHLHGFTPGYATGDDLGTYNIEGQMAAAGKSLMAILPQGSDSSDFNGGQDGKAFDSDTFIAAVFQRLVEEGIWNAEDAPQPGRVILSSHSGGDQSISEMLTSGQGAAGKAPEKLAGLFLFDTMIASSFGGSVWTFVDARINQELDHLRMMRFSRKDPKDIEAEMIAWIKANGFRLQVVYRKGGAYDAVGRDIDGKLALRFASSIKELGAPGTPVYEAMRANFAVHEITDITRIQHMDVLKGDDAFQHAIDTLPTDAAPEGVPRTPQPNRAVDDIDTPQLMRLAATAGNRAMTRMLARDTAPPQTVPETVTTTLRWNTTKPPQHYLEDTFTDHPVDWKADVYVDGAKVGSGDGTYDLTLPKGSKHEVKVVPTPADAASDYYLPAKRKLSADATATVDIKLGYHRENQRFTDQSWENVGIDAVKARQTSSAEKLLGHPVTVNTRVLPTVKKTNDHFNGLSADDQAAVTKSLVFVGGFNRRTTSEGTFSNHSTGCAVDINTNDDTSQNLHFKKKDEGMKKRMELFAHVVQSESGWGSFDGWTETDPTKWVEASRLFNVHFPMFLSALLDDAAGAGHQENTTVAQLGEAFDWLGGTAAVGTALVTQQDAGKLRKAAAAAKKAGKADTEKWLKRTADDWKAVRAWIEGVVMYSTEEWAYVSDHQARVAAGKEKRTPVGELHGMIPLHPKLVETMIAGGWTWLVDEQHAKDLMHFEDRAAFAAIKR